MNQMVNYINKDKNINNPNFIVFIYLLRDQTVLYTDENIIVKIFPRTFIHCSEMCLFPFGFVFFFDKNIQMMNCLIYSILKRTYYKDGTINTEMYYDSNENPVSLKKGQYGIKRYNNVLLYLDKNGNIQINIDNILNGYPIMVIVFGCIVSILLLLLPKKMSVYLTMMYVIFILYETLMFRESGDARLNLVLFSYAKKFFQYQTIRVEVINNIWLFIPFGIGMYRIFQNKSVLFASFIFSLFIETTQYMTGLGVAELNDIFGNTLGGVIGVYLAYVFIKQYKK